MCPTFPWWTNLWYVFGVYFYHSIDLAVYFIRICAVTMYGPHHSDYWRTSHFESRIQLTLDQHWFELHRPTTLICRFFSINMYCSTTWSAVGWIWGYGTVDSREQTVKLYTDFSTFGGPCSWPTCCSRVNCKWNGLLVT